MKRTLTEQQKKPLSVLAIVIFVLLSAALAWFVGRPMVRFARQPEQFRAWVDGHGAWGPLAYAAMVFLQVLVAIIPGEPLEIAGGYAFGAWAGTALCLLGAVLGSVTVFALVRRWGRGLVEVFFPADKLEKLHFLLHTSPKRTALFWLIFTGGLAYTLGMIPFARKTKGAHFIWHFFVVAGALLQWIGEWMYVF